MPDEMTRADSLRFALTGAASDGGAQAAHDAALGNYRSSTEIPGLAATRGSAIANVSLDMVSEENGTGTGTLTAASADTLTWTPPGGSAGTAVTVLDGETKILEGGSAPNKFVRVTRTSAVALTGTESDVLADNVNNVWGFPNVTSAEAAAGEDYYLAIAIKNESADTVGSVKGYLATLGTQRTSNSAQLSGAGAGTITTTGSFADWPDSGYARVTQSGGTLREICYYASRTSTSLSVPAAGRGLLGTAAGAGSATDVVDAVPGMRLAKEAPTGSATAGNAQTIANIGTAPTGVTWNTGITAATGVDIGNLTTGQLYFLWLHRHVTVGHVANPSVLQHVKFAFDAA